MANSVINDVQVAASYEHADAREYETLLAEATDPELEDERLVQVDIALLLSASCATLQPQLGDGMPFKWCNMYHS